MKKILILLLLLPIALFAFIAVRFKLDGNIDYTVSTPNTTTPQFSAQDIRFEHRYAGETSIQTMGAAVIQIDGAGPEELFLGGGDNQDDAIFRFVDGHFVDATKEFGYRKDSTEPTLSAQSLDVDMDGDDDLIVTRSSGVWLYENADGMLSGRDLKVPLADDTSPISVAVADLNRDGHFDMYVSGYIRKELIEGLNIFNKEGYGGTSALLINNGDNSFSDQTQAAGLSYVHNTFQSVFIDVDADGLEDLVVAHDTGQVRTWRNLGDMQFANMPNPNSEVFGYPMGIAVDDYDNNGLVDFFFSNTGTTAPGFLAKGDLREDQTYHPKWILFRNDGGFNFTDTAQQAKLADYEFSWGAVFEDFNLDGRPDLVVSENFVDLLPYKLPFLRLPGRFLVQNESGEFAEVGAAAGVVNKRFSISPLTADFNLDGAPDLVHANLAGKSQAFISSAANANFIRVQLPNTTESVGAVASAELADGRVIYRPFVKGEGLCADSSSVITLGTDGQGVSALSVRFLDGTIVTPEQFASGQTLRLSKPEPVTVDGAGEGDDDDAGGDASDAGEAAAVAS